MKKGLERKGSSIKPQDKREVPGGVGSLRGDQEM